MADEGYVYRPSTPRFNRSSLSHIFANRFYAGDLVRNGQVYPGRHKLVIERRTFSRQSAVEPLDGGVLGLHMLEALPAPLRVLHSPTAAVQRASNGVLNK